MNKNYVCMMMVATVAASLATAVNAEPMIRVVPTFLRALDAGFNEVPGVDINNPPANVSELFLEYDVSIALSGLADNEDFGAVNFNVELGPGLTSLGYVGVSGEFDLFDSPLPTDNRNFFTINADQMDTTDLQNILTFTSKEVADSRQYGESPRPKSGSIDLLGDPTKIGSFFVQWDDAVANPTELRIQPVAVEPFLTFANNATGNGDSTAHEEGFVGEVAILGVPEPGSAVMLALGSLAMLSRRRRA